MRLFVCTWLCPDNQALYGDLIANLVASSRGALRAIPKDSAHITYAFLARVQDRALDGIVDAVRDVAARHVPIAIQLGPLSILYARAEARLVYAPIVHGAHTLAELGSDIVAALERRLPGTEIGGSHSPHVTLGRFRKHTRRGEARATSLALERGAVGSQHRADEIAEIQIVSSELTATGPEYVTQYRASLDRRG